VNVLTQAVAGVILAFSSVIGVASLAGAATPTQGSIVPDSAVPVGSYTTDAPFASGQGVNVVIPMNSVFASGTYLGIIECTAPDGVIPTAPSACDIDTVSPVFYNGTSNFAATSDGSANYKGETGQLFPIYALPDEDALGEPSSSPASCGDTAATECILLIEDASSVPFNNQGQLLSFNAPYVWSQPFFVAPSNGDLGLPAGDGSVEPPANTPEIAAPVLLPLSIFAVGAVAYGATRRRTRRHERQVAESV